MDGPSARMDGSFDRRKGSHPRFSLKNGVGAASALLLLLVLLLLDHLVAVGGMLAGEGGDIELLRAINRQLGGDARQRFALHGRGDRLLRVAAEDSLVRRDVAEVAPDRDLHEVLADAALV